MCFTATIGGRGISICERWRTSFENFLTDMGRKPSSKHTLDRIDVNGNYESSNCQWATWYQQGANKRNSVFIEYNGVKKHVSQWARDLGISHTAILNRLAKGWTPEKIITTPPVDPKLNWTFRKRYVSPIAQ